VTPGNEPHLATFGIHLRQQRCFLLRRPPPAAFNPRIDLHIRQDGLPLARQNALPAEASFGLPECRIYTSLTGRSDVRIQEVGTRFSARCLRVAELVNAQGRGQDL
jgi:hypothetical protein